MKQRLFISFTILIFLSTCKDKDEVTALSRSREAEEYLNVLMDLMQQNSINKYKIDWVSFRATVLATAPRAQSIPETYQAIHRALTLLGDNHSFFVKPDGNFISAASLSCDVQTIGNPTIPDNVGYVRIKQFSGLSTGTAALAYAQDIQDQIKSEDRDNLLGWIVDLRDNSGGNMWPMIAGIGPILGEGIAGYFIDADGNESSWGYLNGSSTLNGNIITSLGNSYELSAPNPKVAVLLNNGVASSGEVVAISFIGRDNSKSFGIPTCGATTSNQSFNLSDHAVLVLTTAHLADRGKNILSNSIPPDIVADNDKVIQQALDWIQN